MRVIICGSRYWADVAPIERVINRLDSLTAEALIVVSGMAPGADLLAYACAPPDRREEHRADWARYGSGAGPIRNRSMLRAGTHLVVAFKDGLDLNAMRGAGTEDMVRIAREADVPAVVYSHMEAWSPAFTLGLSNAVQRWQHPPTLFVGF